MGTARRCEACGSPLADDQHYCLLCGTRAGRRSSLLDTLLARVRAPTSPGAVTGAGRAPTGDGAASAGPAEPVAAERWQPSLPGPSISALLVLLFVGFGALLGDAGAGAGAGHLSAATPALKVLVAHSAPPAQASKAKPGPSGETSSAQPSSEPEPTPAAGETSESSPPSPAAGSGSTAESEPSSGGASGGKAGSPKKPAAVKSKTAKLSDIKHVFEIVLSNEPYAAEFGPESKATYLARTLESKGELLLRYDAIAHEQLPNGIALLSGQGPTAQTAADCPSYTPLTPATAGADQQALGDGCVYPASVQTLPGQLTAKHLSWRAYVQGLDEGAATQPACAHPTAGAADPGFAAGVYATYRNPFVYFESITTSPACASGDVGLAQLKADLSGAASKVPAFSYIVPDRCDDGGPLPCSPGAPSGASDASALLAQIVPQIMASKAYRQGGLIVITSDEAPSSGEYADSSSCCGQPPYPNLTTSGLRHGGGVIGALLLSPFVKGATTAPAAYNHYSLLRTVEDIFGLAHLGYAALPAVSSFSATLLNAPRKG